MEFLDEDTRPRFLFQSRPLPSPIANRQTHPQSHNKVFLFITVLLSSLFFLLSILFLEIEPFRSLLLWLSISLFLGPFAPSHLTCGDIRVGQGPIVEPPHIDQDHDVSAEKHARKKKPSRHVKAEEIAKNPTQNVEKTNGLMTKEGKSEALVGNENRLVRNEGEKEWNEEDVEILKKQMAKNPVGKPRRWEVIAEAFNGRHGVENVVKKAKELGERKDSDSFAQFLKNRKPLDSRIQGEREGIAGESKEDNSGDGGGVGWNAGEDIALLNALKAFPKDVAMRWEKIAAAVPGKSKAACIKRVAELKRGFRLSKAGVES